MLSQFVYGTQYYRAPTPLPEEWEKDISKFDSLGINYFQIRAQWRWNEPREGVYCFDDIDRLFEIAGKCDKKVIFKFMLECAPQYIFRKYNGVRRDFNGQPLREGTNGSMYVGGWWPCFENPKVRDHATRFVEKCVIRYKDFPQLVLWNTWNEPRSRPAEDCACEYSIRIFRKWLESKYENIEKFNSFFGVREDSFSTISAPGMPHGYWDFFLFRKWRGTSVLAERIKWVYDTIRKHDTSRPIMAHVGYSSCIQDTARDTSDDFSISKSTDFYGTSFPVESSLKTQKDEVLCGLIVDFIRHIDKNFFVHELYPDWGNWTMPVSVEDLRFKVWTILSRAAKGIVYWQYRAERLGNENNLAGLVNMDGRFNNRSIEAGKIGKIINQNKELFHKLNVPRSDVGILYDFDSALISQIEDTGRDLWDFSIKKNAINAFNQAHRGMYELFFNLSVPVDYMDTRDLEKILDYRIIYAPYLTMIKPETAKKLEKFVFNGGLLLADEGFGLRQQNTWLHTNYQNAEWKNLIPAFWIDRVKNNGEDKILLPTGKVSVTPMRTVFKSESGIVLAKYMNGQPAIYQFTYGKGNIILFGSSIGYSFQKFAERPWIEWIGQYIEKRIIRKNPCDNIEKGIYSRTLKADNKEVIIIFNRSKMKQQVNYAFGKNSYEITGEVNFNGKYGKVTIDSGKVACIVLE